MLLALTYGCNSAPISLPTPAAEQAPLVSASNTTLASESGEQNSAPPQSADVSPMASPITSSLALAMSDDRKSASSTATTTKDDANSIYFTFGTTHVDLDGQQKLRAHALRLKENPDLEVTLIGHTDNLGSRSYNQAIAEQRIETVSKLLLSYRVKKSQIRRYAVGHEKAERSCTTKACRQKMRRVELIFSP
ncbi:MAG: OmpA family protein [Rhodoferax sp.]|nr:OmpA family protein [Rhodoferax sp.]